MWHQLNKSKLQGLCCVRQLYSTLLLSTQVYNGIIRPTVGKPLQNASYNPAFDQHSIKAVWGGRGGGGLVAVVGYSTLFHSTEKKEN